MANFTQLFMYISVRVFKITFIIVCGYLAVHFLTKKGHSNEGARGIGRLIALGLLLLFAGIAYDIASCTANSSKDSMDNTENIESIEEIPFTEEMLGLVAASTPITISKNENECAMLEYTVTLVNGDTLKYTYNRFVSVEDAKEEWEKMNKIISNDVNFEYDYCNYEWYDGDLSPVNADNVSAVVYERADFDLVKTIYNIQKMNIQLYIEYSGTALSESQLQVIGSVLP